MTTDSDSECSYAANFADFNANESNKNSNCNKNDSNKNSI